MSDSTDEVNTPDVTEEKEEFERSTATGLPREVAFVPPREPLGEDHTRIGEMIHRYRITGLLGRGGMGVVYSARDLKLKRKVALKLLPVSAGESAEQRHRFQREARLGAAVSHPNIAAVFDVGEADDVVFIAMECVEGRSLRAVMTASRTAFPEADAFQIAREIARGLAAAHEVGVTHRDIKPENVMVSNKGAVKLVDFGLAKAHGASAFGSTGVTTQEGRIAGTPSYMSPEQARGLPADARSDVFAFGVVLYELLARRRPFRGATVADVLAAVLRDVPPPLPFPHNGARGPIVRIVSRCLEKDPSLRYAHAGALLAALESAAPTVMRVFPQPSRRRRRLWLVWLWLGAPAIAGAIVATVRSVPKPSDVILPPQSTSTTTVVMTEPSGPTPPEREPPNEPLLRVAPFRLPIEGGVTALAASYNSLALTSRGDIFLRRGSPASHPTWFMLDPIPHAKSIAASTDSMLAVDHAGKLWVWTASDPVPLRLDHTSRIRSVAVNFRDGAFLLRENGTVSMIDYRARTAAQRPISTEWIAHAAIETVPGMDRVKAISARDDGFLALRDDGTVWSWSHYQGHMSSSGWVVSGPQQVQGLSNVVAIASGEGHSLALDKDGAVWAWGSDTYHQVGRARESYYAGKVPGLPRIKAIAAGKHHSLAIDDTGLVWDWGTSYETSQMMNARVAQDAHLPRLVEGLPRVRLVATNGASSLAVAIADGGLWAWGITN